jgi:hypothetical protein
VKLDEQTGKVIWAYQLTPHDIYDYDLENSPIVSNANGRQIVIDGGKAGILVAVDAETGKPIWKTEVGVHNGHQNDNIAALHGDFSKLDAPVTIEPGDLGGIESQLASDGKTVYAAVNNLPSHYASDDGGLAAVSFAPPSSGTGELVAVDEATGKVKWDRKLPSSAYGAATITNGVVFTTTFDGTLYAFNSDTGAELCKTKLSAGTNAPVAVFGDTVVTAASLSERRGPEAADHRLSPRGEEPAPDLIPGVHQDDRTQLGDAQHDHHGHHGLLSCQHRQHREPRCPGRPARLHRGSGDGECGQGDRRLHQQLRSPARRRADRLPEQDRGPDAGLPGRQQELHRDARPGHLHLLLLGARSASGRHAGNPDGQVMAVLGASGSTALEARQWQGPRSALRPARLRA